MIDFTLGQYTKMGELDELWKNVRGSGEKYNMYIDKEVRTIGETMFSHDRNINNVIFEEGSKLSCIGPDAFLGSSLASINLEACNLLCVIDEYAFYHCYNLNSLKICSKNKVTIGYMALNEDNLQYLYTFDTEIFPSLGFLVDSNGIYLSGKHIRKVVESQVRLVSGFDMGKISFSLQGDDLSWL